jgi:F0F1-type ATP synthase assembly protein I
MQFIVKILISLAIIVFCSQIGRKFPSLAGLIATMPLMSVIVLVWLYSDNPGNADLMKDYTRGAVGGILPSILFFIVAYACFRRQLPFGVVLSASFGVWFLGALVHQWLLR